MEQKTIAVRLDPEQLQKLEALAEMTKWNQSDVIRRLIDAAYATPPSIGVKWDTKKGEALAVA